MVAVYVEVSYDSREYQLPVLVEVRPGTPVIVANMPDGMMCELREVVRAAISNAGFEFPMSQVKIGISHLRLSSPAIEGLPTQNIAPAARAIGVAVAFGVLAETKQIRAEALDDLVVAGGASLSLDGSVRDMPGLTELAQLTPEVV